MFHSLSFRAKIILSQLILFIIFFAVLMPFVENTVAGIVQRTFVTETKSLIEVLEPAQTDQEMIEIMEREKIFLFTRVSLFNDQCDEIFDTLLTQKELKEIDKEGLSEIKTALTNGYGYIERVSSYYGVRFVFIALAFESHGQTFVLRTSYPYGQIEEMMKDFEKSFLILGSFILAFFMLMTWLIFVRLSQPIEQIIQAIKPYQEGQTDEFPYVELSEKVGEKDELRKLANTLNFLSERVKSQVQKIREERNEKEAILESLGEGVIAVDATRRMQYVNFMAAKMLGASRKQLIGATLDSIDDKANLALSTRCNELLVSCQRQKIVMTDSISFGEGRKLYLDLIAAPKADEGGAILVLQDNSNHYRILEVGKDFVANASHELRTPITIIRGFAETLQDLPELSQEMLHDITEKILRSCHRMDNLVKSLLTLADIESLPLSNLQKIDLIQLIENCIEHLSTVRPEAEVKVVGDYQQPIIISVAAELFELALFNLLENAAKYSSPPAHITITLKKLENAVSIAIADRGMGIPPADLDHIFERFYTVNKAHSRKLGGAGLGLSIVKTIIEKHDGTISVTSEVGKGTCFTILVPVPH